MEQSFGEKEGREEGGDHAEFGIYRQKRKENLRGEDRKERGASPYSQHDTRGSKGTVITLSPYITLGGRGGKRIVKLMVRGGE